ncbi:MAG: type III-A CRISPR-associated RAMP protein Csm4 [Methanobrevibacter sp.]|jgi:CRISPR-associated protein Csm4|nr:type III-A CRISPR-associated RAMP protein Csm4 [Candidatus Methanovirga australis]
MIIYIKPRSIFPNLSSNKIFGAICHSINELYPDFLKDMIKDFNNNPPFILSSGFPTIYNGENKVRFYPKPLTYENMGGVDPDYYKKYKKIEFIQEEIFFKLSSGDLNQEEIIKNFDSYESSNGLLIEKEFDSKFSKNEFDHCFSKITLPNNSVNRITNETEGIFYTEGKMFKKSGLFFIIEFSDDENEKKYKDIIKSVIRFLRDRGFGGDISTGKGHFDYEIEDFSLPSYESNYFLTLSQYIPSDENLNRINENSFYEISSKRGRNSNGEIRKKVSFFKEGSVFPHYNEFYGKIVESGENSPASEYGYAFPFKYKFKGD